MSGERGSQVLTNVVYILIDYNQVSTIEEGKELRNAGIPGPICLIGLFISH